MHTEFDPSRTHALMNMHKPPDHCFLHVLLTVCYYKFWEMIRNLNSFLIRTPQGQFLSTVWARKVNYGTLICWLETDRTTCLIRLMLYCTHWSTEEIQNLSGSFNTKFRLVQYLQVSILREKSFYVIFFILS